MPPSHPASVSVTINMLLFKLGYLSVASQTILKIQRLTAHARAQISFNAFSTPVSHRITSKHRLNQGKSRLIFQL